MANSNRYTPNFIHTAIGQSGDVGGVHLPETPGSSNALGLHPSGTQSGGRTVLTHGNAHKDFSCFAPFLGMGFVVRAVDCVANCRLTEQINARTWWDNYAKLLWDVLEALARYVRVRGDSFDPSNIALLTKYIADFDAEVRGCGQASKTISKRVLTYNKLFACLAQAGVLPTLFALTTSRTTERAPIGKAKATVEALLPRAPRVKDALKPSEFSAHGRTFSLRQLAELGFLQPALARVQGCIVGASGKSKAEQLYISFRSLLSSLIAQRDAGEHSGLFSQLANHGSVGHEEVSAWLHAVHAWRDALPAAYRDADQQLVTAHGHVLKANEMLHALAEVGVAPPTRLKGFKNARNKSSSKRRLSLAEVTLLSEKQESAVASLWEQMQHRFDPDEENDVRGFLRALCEALTPEEVSKLSASQLLEEMHKLNNLRLQNLRDRAVAAFRRWHQHWLRGQEALNAPGVLPGDQLVALLDSPLLSVSQKRMNATTYLRHDESEVQLGNCLNYVLAAAGGMTSMLRGRFHHMVRQFGGHGTFQAYLHPHKEATLALWVIAMADTGANCEVVRETSRDCLGSVEGSKRLVKFADKCRADDKPIEELFNIEPIAGEELSLVQAIEAYLVMSTRYAGSAHGIARERLLVHERGREIRPVEEYNARDWFKRFAKENSDVIPSKALPTMIRPAVLMRTQFQHGITAAQARGDHKSANTTFDSYTGRTPATLRYELDIQEFVLYYEAVATEAISGAADKLGVSPEEMNRLLDGAVDSGLGILARNPLQKRSPTTSTALGDDAHWVVASDSVIRDLIKFNEWLRDERERSPQHDPTSWATKWEPWLVYTDMALAKLASGETAAAFARATEVLSATQVWE